MRRSIVLHLTTNATESSFLRFGEDDKLCTAFSAIITWGILIRLETDLDDTIKSFVSLRVNDVGLFRRFCTLARNIF